MITLTSSSFVAAQPSPSELGWLSLLHQFTDGSTTRYTYDALGRKLRVEHKTMTTGTFHPDTGTEDPGDVGTAPDPEVGEEAGEEGGEWQWPVEGEEWPELAGLEEMEGEEGEPAEGEGPTLPPTEPLLPPLPPTCLPYEITVTDYVGSYIYENSKLSRLIFDGGFITFPYVLVPNTSNGDPQLTADLSNPEYHYYFTDHLGSVRVVTNDQGNIKQTNNYYPYGGLMASSSCIANPSSSTAANQPNRYNGKELDRRNALDWHDYGARYFAGHGQWTSIDPLAEKYYDWSPYVYCIGNPIKFVDPDGREIIISGVLNESALQQLQERMKGRITLYMDSKGFLNYSINEGCKLRGNAKRIAKIIDDKTITINLITTDKNETSTGNLFVGGAFMGNIVETDANGNRSVNAYQEVNPSVLGNADYFTDTQGKMIMHEITEAYEGARIAKETGKNTPPASKSDESNRKSVYKRAHRKATSQSAIQKHLYDINGNITYDNRRAIRAEWKVVNGNKSQTIMSFP